MRRFINPKNSRSDIMYLSVASGVMFCLVWTLDLMQQPMLWVASMIQRHRQSDELLTALILVLVSFCIFQCRRRREDRSAKLRAAEHLLSSEAAFRSFVDHSPLGIMRVAAGGDRLLAVNPALVEILGYDSAEELLQVSLSRDVFVDAAHCSESMKAMSYGVCESEGQWKKRDGKQVQVLLRGHAVHGLQGAAKTLEMTVEDISLRKSLEEQLRQAQKMEAVGRLAGGVAHDFNNILGVIMGNSELLQLNGNLEQKTLKRLGEIDKASQRASALTKQLLTFSRRQLLQPKVLDLNQVVKDMETMLRRLVGEDMKFTTALDSELKSVLADPGQMEQVLMNLAVNARDAMPVGGLLSIHTKNIYLDETAIRQRPSLAEGNYVMLAVSDTGCGMTDEVKAHIFEPFFTTKERGRGTGLGLSTVYGIVEQSGGHIMVYSELGRGSTFKVFLPATEEAAVGETSQLAQPSGGSETILLVEDEVSLLRTTADFLQSAGYHVLEANSGERALQLLNETSVRPDMLLTDIIMPGRSGREVAAEVHRLGLRIPVLYMTGYTDDVILHHGMFADSIALIQKPFSRGALLTKIRETFDQVSARAILNNNSSKIV